jgi:VIT1/CCC1 family predicted Fe2+/Mn2+ transporter
MGDRPPDTSSANGGAGTLGDAADHIVEARDRARRMLGGEAHLGAVDDWRQSLATARDTLVMVWLVWVGLASLGHADAGGVLIATAVGMALYRGVATARSTATQANYYATEFERERTEIREHFDEECEEIRALYAAKGFREPMLTQIVQTLSADDDRLLKVMMEEELGLHMHHMHHPIVVGVWHFAAAALGGLALTLPSLWLSGAAGGRWMVGGGLGLLAVLAVAIARTSQRSVAEVFASTLLMALVAGGTVHYLALLLSGSSASP